jgi:GNAT superfamily N-acetyltransferase
LQVYRFSCPPVDLFPHLRYYFSTNNQLPGIHGYANWLRSNPKPGENMPTLHITRYNHPSQNWLDAVLALRAEFGDSDSPEPFASFILGRLEDETMLLALAWDGEKPVGYGLAFDVESDSAKPEWTRTGYIAQFLVTQDYRQLGVGGLLIDYIDAWFTARGLKKVLLNVNMNNEPGIRFWEKHGFQPYALRMKRVAE